MQHAEAKVDVPLEISAFVGENDRAPYDPHIGSNILGTVNAALFGYLLKISPTHEIIPGLIESWRYDFARKRFIFVLSDAKFHHGRPVTSQDVEFAIVRGFISTAENYNRIHFSEIKGTKELTKGTKFKTGLLAGFSVIDQRKFEIELETPNPNFLLNFTVPFAPVVPPEEVLGDYYTWKSEPVGAGPYRIQGRFKDHRLSLEKVTKNPTTADLIHFDTKRRTQKYDLVFDTAVPTTEEREMGAHYGTHPSMITAFFFFRENRRNLNVNFRKAIYHGLNRDELTLDTKGLAPAYEMMVRPHGGRSRPKNPYDLKLAISAFEKLSKEDRLAPVRIGKFDAPGPVPESTLVRNKLIQKQLEKIGFKVEISFFHEKFPTPEVMAKFDIKYWSKVVDLSDPVVSYGALAKDSPYSLENPSVDGQYDTLYQRAFRAPDIAERLTHIQALSNLIEDQALIVPILERYVVKWVNPEKIRSLGEQPKPLFLDLEKMVVNRTP